MRLLTLIWHICSGSDIVLAKSSASSSGVVNPAFTASLADASKNLLCQGVPSGNGFRSKAVNETADCAHHLPNVWLTPATRSADAVSFAARSMIIEKSDSHSTQLLLLKPAPVLSSFWIHDVIESAHFSMSSKDMRGLEWILLGRYGFPDYEGPDSTTSVPDHTHAWSNRRVFTSPSNKPETRLTSVKPIMDEWCQ